MQTKKILSLIAIVFFISAGIAVNVKPASGLLSQNNVSWYTTSDTNAAAIATGDVNGDGQLDLVTAGYFNDGTSWNGQIVVSNAANLAFEASTGYKWGTDSQISCVAIGDVNGDGKNEIVTGGQFFDGTRWVANIIVWNGTTLGAIGTTAWYWFGNTQVSSIAVANVSGGASLDIVSGGAFFDGTRYVAQVIDWNSATMTAQRLTSWYWFGDTTVNSLTIANLTGGTSLNVITAGSYKDGTRENAQLIVWNGADLSVNSLASWFTTSNTVLNSVKVTISTTLGNRIIVGGSFFDNSRSNSQITIWG
jgi:hypothetical protein